MGRKATKLCTATVLLITVMTVLCGCTNTRYVPVETVRTEYRDREVERLLTDTVRDTRFIWVKGDTIVDVREKEHVKRVEIHDTCFMERTNTIRVPYPVERELTRWERAKMDLGGVAMGVIAAAACIAVVWLIKKFRK